VSGLGPGAPGETGRFPDGKHSEDDCGELEAHVLVERGYVTVRFGKPITWLRMRPNEALAWAEALVRNAKEAEKEPS
jgi:hypothetical protein